MSKVQKICQGMAIITVASSLLSGCSQVVKTGANVALGFSEKGGFKRQVQQYKNQP